MSPVRYLAYGSNLLPARLAARLEAIRPLGAVALPDWTLRFHKAGADGSGKCDLVPQRGALAWGAIYEISPADRARLDRIEGVGRGYRATHITIADAGPCYVYLAETSHVDPGLVPFDWYHGFVLAGARHHGFPEDYLSVIETVETVVDHDAERRASNLRLLGLPPEG